MWQKLLHGQKGGDKQPSKSSQTPVNGGSENKGFAEALQNVKSYRGPTAVAKPGRLPGNIFNERAPLVEPGPALPSDTQLLFCQAGLATPGAGKLLLQLHCCAGSSGSAQVKFATSHQKPIDTPRARLFDHFRSIFCIGFA